MRKLIFNSKDKVRVIWRLLSFIILAGLLSIPFQLGLREVLDAGLLRTNLNRIFSFLGMVGSLYVQIKYIDKSSFGKYGLNLEKPWMKEFAIGCAIASLQLVLFFLTMHLSDNLQVVDFFITSSPDHTFEGGFVTELIINLSASITEEIMFRAFLFYIIFESFALIIKSRATSAVITAVLVSQLFGFAHFGNDGATLFSSINLGFDALTICLPFLLTRRLGMSIGMHFSWNVTQAAILGFANSGNIPKASIISSSMPDNMWTGGVFGPEGSVLLLAMDFIAVLLILLWKYKNNIKHWVHPDIVNP
ncbi:CAAX protease self-immunity [Reichenbachiella faecimaris]|uniref:CAAX protease self-immunity n=1 Tax=Reichenbachiella faecimaris TaxID=692418 RepID=A0A1W2G7J8_REIFA|nr:type II CAAX endopeptidase family protein [Reichenbachiella faecimaris]SMD32655.1 CAAX protease self-immunity [Reichenbachiella faecimaris]